MPSVQVPTLPESLPAESVTRFHHLISFILSSTPTPLPSPQLAALCRQSLTRFQLPFARPSYRRALTHLVSHQVVDRTQTGYQLTDPMNLRAPSAPPAEDPAPPCSPQSTQPFEPMLTQSSELAADSHWALELRRQRQRGTLPTPAFLRTIALYHRRQVLRYGQATGQRRRPFSLTDGWSYTLTAAVFHLDRSYARKLVVRGLALLTAESPRSCPGIICQHQPESQPINARQARQSMVLPHDPADSLADTLESLVDEIAASAAPLSPDRASLPASSPSSPPSLRPPCPSPPPWRERIRFRFVTIGQTVRSWTNPLRPRPDGHVPLGVHPVPQPAADTLTATSDTVLYLGEPRKHQFQPRTSWALISQHLNQAATALRAFLGLV